MALTQTRLKVAGGVGWWFAVAAEQHSTVDEPMRLKNVVRPKEAHIVAQGAAKEQRVTYP